MNELERRAKRSREACQVIQNPTAAYDEIARLQSEVERLRGRLCKTCEGAGMIGGPSPSAPDEGGEPCPECNAWLLRKQAEAVEACHELAAGVPIPCSHHEEMAAGADCMQQDICNVLEDYAQRLRQQAAESEGGNTA